jgi:hypothetical protein
MDPITLITVITAAFALAGPAIQLAIAEAAIVGADVTAHKSAMQTLSDALAGLQSVFAKNPLPAPAANPPVAPVPNAGPVVNP